MIAMQYSFTLPADYDMAIIDRRITEKGPLLDGFPNLRFKAYLTAHRGSDTAGGRENLYAPFYLWDNSTGLNDFLCGDGFAGVTGAFGWPQVRTWMVWQAKVSDRLAQAAFATREILAIEPHALLGELRRREDEATIAAVEAGGALAAVAGFDPTGWTRVRFRLWSELPSAAAGQAYAVGHMSLPSA
jgi:hypothetical protein